MFGKIINYPLKAKQWFASKVKKKFIVWHGSQSRTSETPVNNSPGRAASRIDYFNANDDKVACAYLVDRNATIYSLYPDNEWSYHLFLKDKYYDKVSIPIEFANEGQLTKQDSNYYAFDTVNENTKYFGEICVRNNEYFAKINDVQLDAAIDLTLNLCKKYKIKPIFYNGNKKNSKIWEKATIFCHEHVNPKYKDFILTEDMIQKIKEKMEIYYE